MSHIVLLTIILTTAEGFVLLPSNFEVVSRRQYLAPSLSLVGSIIGRSIQQSRSSKLLTAKDLNIESGAQKSRLDRTAERTSEIEEECILEIDGNRYNLTSWAKAHPGGVNVLTKFHTKDASKAFHSTGHSEAAYAMLKDFLIQKDADDGNSLSPVALSPQLSSQTNIHPENSVWLKNPSKQKKPRWLQKLFTKEDPIGIHKYLGIFCLFNFAYRFGHMYFGEPAACFGSSIKSPWHVMSLVPHVFLSLSSLIFDTVPRERVVGKPMIWKEYRIHNMVFALRGLLCTFLAWLSIHFSDQNPMLRKITVVGSGLAVLATMLAADLATHFLQPNKFESTTATMPYWEGCSKETERRCKTFYAYSQFIATLACLFVSNPAWAFATVFAIQVASFLMTLVRKGMLSTQGSHFVYIITLVMPYMVAIRDGFYMGFWILPAMMSFGTLLFMLRCSGMNKYAIWLPVVAARVLFGDRIIPFDVW